MTDKETEMVHAALIGSHALFIGSHGGMRFTASVTNLADDKSRDRGPDSTDATPGG